MFVLNHLKRWKSELYSVTRQNRNEYEDDISEQFHRELITPFVDPFEQAEEERIEEEKEQLRQLEIAKVRKVANHC